jgi:hypothetical protein
VRRHLFTVAGKVAYVPPKATPVRPTPRQVIDLASISSAMGRDTSTSVPAVRRTTAFHAVPAQPEPVSIETPIEATPAPVATEVPVRADSRAEADGHPSSESISFFGLMRQQDH